MVGAETQWIGEEFLKLAIAQGNADENITVTDFSIKPAVESGDNYCTQLFKVKVVYMSENASFSKSLIIKAPLSESSFAKTLVDDTELLRHEYIMYNQILPKINTISKQQFGPKNYFCKMDNILIMEDLTAEGFCMGNRLQQLDLFHCEKFITTLAEYHATTVALHKTDPELVETNGVHPLYNKKIQSQTLIFCENIKQKAFIDTIKKVHSAEILAETIQSYGNDLRSVFIKLFQRRGSVNVLNHGDCWTNNIMFKYEAGKISDCKLIDFQIRSYGSPATDLLYFLFTSARKEVRQEHMDQMLLLYSDTFNNKLMELGCEERLSLEKLQEEVRQSCLWALCVVMYYVPMVLNEPDEQSEELKKNKANFTSHDINENPILRIYLGKTYNKLLPNLCEDLVKLGVIDCLKNING